MTLQLQTKYLPLCSVYIHAERVKFMKSFADITENNPLLKNNYNIEFADVNYLTEFYINNKDGQRMDLSVLLTGEEYRVFLTLAAKWKE